MNLDHVLHAAGPWLHVAVGTPGKVYDAAWALRREPRIRTASRVLRGTKMRTWAALYDEIGAALQFPPYFGENTNALEECIIDLEWLEADAYVLTILDAVRVLDRATPADGPIFWDILREAAEEWGRPVTEGVPRPARVFRVVAHCSAEEEAGLRKRLPAG
jgi:hypothetical protein